MAINTSGMSDANQKMFEAMEAARKDTQDAYLIQNDITQRSTVDKIKGQTINNIYKEKILR